MSELFLQERDAFFQGTSITTEFVRKSFLIGKISGFLLDALVLAVSILTYAWLVARDPRLQTIGTCRILIVALDEVIQLVVIR